MSNWKQEKFGTIATIVMGQSPSGDTCNSNGDGVPLLNGPTEFGIKFPTPVQYTVDPKKCCDQNDILFCVRGSTTGRMNWANQNFAIGRGLAALRHKSGKAYQYFLRGLIDYHLPFLLQSATGSTFPNVSGSDIANLEVEIPPLIEQKYISELISCFDDKIDLLHRQNKTLEQLSETLFKQWFVVESDSRESMLLFEIAETVNGLSYKSSELNPSKTAMVSLKSFDREGGFRTDGFKEFTGKYKAKHIVVEGDLIVAHTDITQEAEVIGNPIIVLSNPNYEILVFSMDIVKVLPKVEWASIEFLYYLMKTREFKGHCEGNANGSTVLHLNKQAIPTFEFPRPNKNLVIEFTEHARKLMQKTFVNYKQINTLTQIRDILLPKLMSGEVRLRI